MSENRTVSFEDENILPPKLNYFKASLNQKIRIRIPVLDGVLMYNQHYNEVQGAGYIRCLKDKDEPCPICELVGDPVQKFKVNILEYTSCLEDGEAPEDLSTVSMTAKVMKCGIKIFSQIKAKHKKLAKKGGITMFDLIVTCTNEQYQHYEFEDCSECLSEEDPRLKALATKIIKEKFTNFSTYQDRDTKFPTSSQVSGWLKAVLGPDFNPSPASVSAAPVSPKSEEPEDIDDSSDTSEEAEKLIKDLNL